ncbi:MAG TPA: carboxymuconolactone decarboxylase family protein [Candidatus Binataceae bacterium]|nr:carboxymuconolactone decarboxylase family protein [Candidatus Binataceae bacterium]
MFPLLSIEEAKRRGAEVGMREELAAVNAFRSLLQNPKAGGALGRLLTTLGVEGSLDTRLRELVILRTGWRTGSEYEFCQHVAIARRLKIPDADILGVRDPDSCESYNEIDRAVILLVDTLLAGTEIPAGLWGTLTRALEVPQLIELLAVTGTWRLFALYFKAAEVPLDPGVAGWPEGKAPTSRI